MIFPAFLRRWSGWWLAGAISCLTVSAADKPIRLRNPLPSPIEAVAAAAAPGSSAPLTASGLFLIQFNQTLTASEQLLLKQRGVTLLRYVPDDAFVAKLQSAALSDLQALGWIKFIGRYGAEQKVEPRLTQILSTTTTNDEVAVAAVLTDVNEVQLQQARSQFHQLEHETSLPTGRILRGTVARAQFQTFAASEAVLWIEPAPRMKLFDEIASRIVAGDGPTHQTQMQALGYNGAGVTVAVADSGLDSGDTNSMHPDIQGRVRALFYYGTPGQLEDAADEHSHGTHCAGIIAGNGATGETDEDNFLYGLGVAPGASLIGQRIFDAAGGYAPPPSFETLTRDAKRAGADIGSNSWGDDTQGQYDVSAMEFDALVRDADVLALGDQPYILEFSAGNAGPNQQTIGSPAVAKNVIATGASQNNRFNLPIEDFAIYAEGEEAMSDFSSRGPCADGRIKPDLTAPGSWIASLRSVYANDGYAWWPISDNYLYQGGTSQAGPHVAGAAAVFVQYWREHQNGVTPSPALVKAALINSATDMDDGLTTAAAVPNNDEGWGRVDLPALLASTRNYDFTDQTALLTNGGVFEKRILVGSSDEPLKITLAYTDVPGLPAAAVALVNDLDLEVITPTGEIYRGNQFNDGESIPNAPLPDSINNVEAVHLATPAPGEYIIRVRGTRVVEDARQDTAAIDQDFALVASGHFVAPGFGIITLDRQFYRAPDQIRIALVDYDLAGQPSVTIQLRSTTEPAGEAITLFARDASGNFTNSVTTATGSAVADGRLQVAHGDIVEAIYEDTAPAGTRTATAQADLQPPIISGLHTSGQFGQLVVQWNTDEAARGEVYYGASTPDLSVTNNVLDNEQTIYLSGVAPGSTINFFVVASDAAGNRTTNNNNGALFIATNPQPSAVLLLDSYAENGFIAVPPLSGYTDALTAVGANFQVFDATGNNLPTLQQLQSFRCLIWRMDEISAPSPSLVSVVASYVTNGGSLFISGMDTVTRLGEAGATSFVKDILQVQANVEDQPVDEISGYPGDPIGAGISTDLDYRENYDDLMTFLELVGVSDPSDWITPTTNAAPVMLADGQIVGLRAPKTGVDLPGRVVFLSFPLDTVPLGSGIGNNRAGLLQNALNFLAPAGDASRVSLDSDVYSTPGRAIIEVEDVARGGQGSVQVTVGTWEHTNQVNATLLETPRAGLFRGSVLFSPVNDELPGVLWAQAQNTVFVDYFDAAVNRTNSTTATIDTTAPVISNVVIEPGYLEAMVYWDTSKDADSLVQYSESPGNLPNNFVAYDALPTTAHEVFLSGLKPSTTYYLRVTSRDRAGNTTIDDNDGQLYSFTTLQPLTPPWFDNLETNNTDWSVITADESESGWTRGTPGYGETAHSGTNVWGTIRNGAAVSQFESYLISPGILLTGGNQATLHFWQNYDFMAQGDFDIQLAAIEIITNVASEPVLLYQYGEDYSAGWEEMELDLTPFLGNVVYVVWYHFLFSFDAPPRLGWLIDDVSITTSTVVPGTIAITNNLWQSVFALAGPSGRTASGRTLLITNAAPGTYTIQYGDVPYFATPPSQTQTLSAGGSISFIGDYTFTDANTNGVPDAYELEKFGTVDPLRTPHTDTDQDGLSDWAEFVAGTDPNNPPPPFRLRAEALSDQLVQLSWPSVATHLYRVHGSTNGTAWQPVTGWFEGTGTNTSYVLGSTTNGVVRFFRVEANAGDGNIAGLFKLTATPLPNQQIHLDWPTAPGHAYRVMGSTNLSTWAPYTDWIRASGYTLNQTVSPSTNDAPVFFRLEAAP
ncbi:MAG: S8 family serine peptidase [Verrucomicrobiae bacterium]|nr:S8 family serine peptidase [Verrucomicrobiae bacterium]